jgi:hypothetical protein
MGRPRRRTPLAGYINDAANPQQRFFATTQDMLAAIAVKSRVLKAFNDHHDYYKEIRRTTHQKISEPAAL